MRKLIIVSNRLPVTVKKKKGEYEFEPSLGGLATGLSSLESSARQVWVGWPGISLKKLRGDTTELSEKLRSKDFYPVFLPGRDIDEYYYGFCNKTLWPLFHYFLEFVVYNKKFWRTYKRVNKKFFDAVSEIVEPDDVIWVQDYHLMLLPKLLKDRFPYTKIGFFLHIPFPSVEVFRILPWCVDITEGLLGADLVGFHTYAYVRHFFESVRRLLGYDHSLGKITVGNRVIKVDAFPMGIDYEKYSSAVETESVKKQIAKFKKKTKDHKVILSVDRLDYTKGVLERLRAFNTFLESNPEYKEKVVLIAVAAPSRTKVEHYKQLKQKVDNLIGQINGKHGTIGWVPIWYMFRTFGFEDLVALYSISDVALVTPLRDGMNLIAKEFIAAKGKGNSGVLVLSEMTGASNELGEALIINPNDEEGISDALKRALDMPEEEKERRIGKMQSRLKRYNVERWAGDFMDRLAQVKKIQKEILSQELNSERKEGLIEDYRRGGSKRLLLLDYDGTLMPFSDDPKDVEPDEELLDIIQSLSGDSRNKLVLISGRDRVTLDEWLGSLPISLVAEHGVWIKEGVWETIEALSADWKDEIRSILEVHVDRTPGSMIEEKEFSLAWHYRKVDPSLASVRVGELKNILLDITSNLDIGVLEGNKVVEIKNTGINKGRAALRWISDEDWDFILSIGDDWTDEDIFEVLPDFAYSIKVGFGPTKARFNIHSQKEARELLKEIAFR